MTKVTKYVINHHKAVCRLPSISPIEVSMRNRFLIGLFTTAVLLFAAPVAASEVHSSVKADVLDIQSMIQSSRQRQGILQSELIPASAPAPVATAPAPAPVATAPAPASVATAPAPVLASTPVPYDSSTKNSIHTTTIHTTKYTSAPATDPTMEQQWNNKSFMLFVSDLAWKRVDDSSDYRLGATIERRFLSPLAVIRVYEPHMMPKALAILRGEETYS